MALISTLTDNFDDNSIDAAKWETDVSAGGSIAETNQRLEMTSSTSAMADYDYFSAISNYDLTGSGVSIKLAAYQ